MRLTISLIVIVCGVIINAESYKEVPIKHAKGTYMAHTESKSAMSREFRLIKEGLSGQFNNMKAHLNAVVHVNTPGYKRYKYVNYLNNDEDIISIQYIDWTKERPVLSNKLLDVYVSGKFNFFCLEPQNDVELYVVDGRFYKDTDGLLRSVAHHLPVMGENGYIYLSTNHPVIDEKGRVFENEKQVGKLKIKSFKNSDGLWTIEGTVFYQRQPNKVVTLEGVDYQIIQGYYEGQNEPPGMMTSKTISPFAEASAKSMKSYIQTYELFFQAVND